MESVKLAGVRVDRVDINQALEIALGWLKQSPKRTIFTPNFEFIITSNKDPEFKKILNSGDLNIPDSAHLGWLDSQLNSSGLKKFFHWFSFLNSKDENFPVVPGVDFMDKLCKECSENNYSVGFLGSQEGVGEKAAEKLKRKYPKLKVAFTAGSDWNVDKNGQEADYPLSTNHYPLNKTDVLFVAFDHGKQEKWIENYKSKTQAKIFMGVGGALDYISGFVPRAPKTWQNLGLEWLYRLIHQPSRISRQFQIVKFILGLF